MGFSAIVNAKPIETMETAVKALHAAFQLDKDMIKREEVFS